MLYRKNLPGWERAMRVVGGAAMIACGLLGLPGTPIGYLIAGAGVVTIDDRIFRILPDVRHGRPKIAVAMNSLARASRCDPGLIEAARGGDENALVSLITAAQPDVRRYAARNCRAADIDDAVQETLLLLYRRVGTLRAVTSFSAWLFAVAKRACLRLLRMSAGPSRFIR